MSSFRRRIAPYVEREIAQAHALDDPRQAFRHLERAHVLGQSSTVLHVRECLGQIVRLIGAATKTAIGWVPTGNTGGARVNPFARMPISPDLAALLAQARQHPSSTQEKPR